jgi:hypothetical protein
VELAVAEEPCKDESVLHAAYALYLEGELLGGLSVIGVRGMRISKALKPI